MSTTNSRPKCRKNDLHKPLDPKHLERGRALAARYQAVIWLEDGEYYGRGLELPWTFEDGKTPDECFAKLRDAMAETVAFMLDNGQNPPAPVGEAKRTAQVNRPVENNWRGRAGGRPTGGLTSPARYSLGDVGRGGRSYRGGAAGLAAEGRRLLGLVHPSGKTRRSSYSK